jgi:hypothetical protein
MEIGIVLVQYISDTPPPFLDDIFVVLKTRMGKVVQCLVRTDSVIYPLSSEVS